MYHIRWTDRFYRDVKRCKKKRKDMEKFKVLNELIQSGDNLPKKYKDHALLGNWKGYRECHIERDWLLIYRVLEQKQEIEYVRMGTHDDLF